MSDSKLKQWWKWAEVHVIGNRCPKCGEKWKPRYEKDGWKTRTIWSCENCGHEEDSKV